VPVGSLQETTAPLEVFPEHLKKASEVGGKLQVDPSHLGIGQDADCRGSRTGLKRLPLVKKNG